MLPEAKLLFTSLRCSILKAFDMPKVTRSSKGLLYSGSVSQGCLSRETSFCGVSEGIRVPQIIFWDIFLIQTLCLYSYREGEAPSPSCLELAGAHDLEASAPAGGAG